MRKYAKAKINRNAANLPPIILEEVTVTESEFKGMVIVTGKQLEIVETKAESELPQKEVEEPLSWWHPARLFFGKKTRKIIIPNSEGWKPYGYDFHLGNLERSYVRIEPRSVTYHISPIWLELSEH